MAWTPLGHPWVTSQQATLLSQLPARTWAVWCPVTHCTCHPGTSHFQNSELTTSNPAQTHYVRTWLPDQYSATTQELFHPNLGKPTCPRHSTGPSSLHIPLEHNGLATSWWQATNPGLTHIMSASPTPMQPQQEATLHSKSSEGLTPPCWVQQTLQLLQPPENFIQSTHTRAVPVVPDQALCDQTAACAISVQCFSNTK